MPTEPLPPDPESVEQWKQLPQTRPSRDAYPPMTGGLRLSRGLLLGGGILLVLAVVLQLLVGR